MPDRNAELSDDGPVRKNCMGAIAKIYGVSLGEMFYLESPSGKAITRCKLDEEGLWSYEYNSFGSPYWHDISWALYELVTGKLIVRKMTTSDTVKDFLEGK